MTFWAVVAAVNVVLVLVHLWRIRRTADFVAVAPLGMANVVVLCYVLIVELRA
jgi:hypothetical protein